jgi:hypothetical protein
VLHQHAGSRKNKSGKEKLFFSLEEDDTKFVKKSATGKKRLPKY